MSPSPCSAHFPSQFPACIFAFPPLKSRGGREGTGRIPPQVHYSSLLYVVRKVNGHRVPTSFRPPSPPAGSGSSLVPDPGSRRLLPYTRRLGVQFDLPEVPRRKFRIKLAAPASRFEG